jgi:hypothetical protein
MTQRLGIFQGWIMQADPRRVQLGGRRARSAPIAVEECVHLKDRVAQ